MIVCFSSNYIYVSFSSYKYASYINTYFHSSIVSERHDVRGCTHWIACYFYFLFYNNVCVWFFHK